MSPSEYTQNVETVSFEKRLRDALSNLEGGSGSIMPLLQELVSVLLQKGSAEKILEQAEAAWPPKGTEAEKWHKMAVQATGWSLAALAEKQQSCFARLREAVQGDMGSAGEVRTSGMPLEAESIMKELAGTHQAPQAQSGSSSEGEGGKPVAPRRRQEESEGSMKHGLESLRGHSHDCILSVRKIKKLGFESPAVLTEHFSQYGDVVGVYVANSMMKPSPKRPAGRVRPAALGFAVMSDSAGAARALAAGLNQQVGSVVIEVKEFEPFLDAAADEGAEL